MNYISPERRRQLRTMNWLIAATALAAAVSWAAAIIAIVSALDAHGGEITDCSERHGTGRWVYRVVDDRKCWFPAGRLRRGQEKPVEELRWPGVVPATPETLVNQQPPQQPSPSPKPEPLPKIEPTEFELRFHGDAR